MKKALLTRNGALRKLVIKNLRVKVIGNPLIKTDEDRKNIRFLKKICLENPTHFDAILNAKRYVEKYAGIKEWIVLKTPKLVDSADFVYRLKTRIYWIFNGLTDFPKCLNEKCGNKIGFRSDVESVRLGYCYQTHCSVKCASSDENVKAKNRKTEVRRYGKPNFRNTKQSRKTCMERYGVSNYAQTEEYRSRCAKKKVESKSKEIASKRRNGTLNTSKLEQQCYSMLVKRFGRCDVFREYRCERYPFFCDFYVKSRDLFIECNFHWTHGGHPYSSSKDVVKLGIWQNKAETSRFYSVAIDTWTVRDVKKRKCARRNGLNYAEFWNMDDFRKWFESVV